MNKHSIDFKLYLITDRKLFTTVDLLYAGVEDALKAGVKAVQLREKDLPTRDLLALSYRFRELTTRYGAMLFINDRLDIAMSVNADGVHLGQSSIPVYAVRNVVGRKLKIGFSAHNLEEALTAEKEGADFITFGPLYQTPSKLKYGNPVGLEALKKVKGSIYLPIFGIGGIKLNNAVDVMQAGASGIALISGILGAADIRKAAGEYLKIAGEKI
jgi:thiamine-phosphate pyrophosphorylase